MGPVHSADHVASSGASLPLRMGQADHAQSRRLQLRIKRAIDVVVSTVALLTLLPLFAVIAGLIMLDSRGPILFSQKRWGRGDTVIRVYKFRSMAVEHCDHSGVTQTVVDDPRVTRVGKILRKTNIDELPQLFNVLRGDMSLVGPRCHAIGMKAAGILYEDLVPAYHQRHRMRPGITGLAQMRGHRGPTDTKFKSRARVTSDLHYVENFTLLLDLRIVLATIRNEIAGGTGF